jgi:hypothetical protein
LRELVLGHWPEHVEAGVPEGFRRHVGTSPSSVVVTARPRKRSNPWWKR